jgi:hypothetical protein
MTGDGKIPPLRPEPERDRWKRYVLPCPEGGKAAYTRATTVVGALKDLNGLIGWKQRMTAVGMARTPGLVARVLHVNDAIEAAGDDWREARDAKRAMTDVVEQLMHAGGADRGSEAGTEAHTLSEWYDAGRLDEVNHLATDSQIADLQAYVTAMRRAGIVRPPEYIERIVINQTIESAGTFDRLVYLPDGRLVVADLKSQKSVDFGFLDAACQMAQYANADYLVDGEQLLPMPAELDRSIGIVMHAPVGTGTCDLYEVNLEIGWEAALVARDVRRLRDMSKSMGRPYAPEVKIDLTPRVIYLIEHAQTRASLTAIWSEHVEAGREWTPAMQAAAVRVANALDAASAP